ncbi:MAG: hypothetical protein JEZ09_17255 [Salinivirgaceae bacterium]|nr:hypothetical protein [Salinivirgaceae bacterium]
MTVLNKLASTLGQKGSDANIALAKEIAETKNHEAVKELVLNLNNKDKRIQSDCIKAIYETAYINPKLIAAYHPEFIGLLTNKNNRLVWGAMIALASITDIKHKEIFSALDSINESVEKGSVITIDCGVDIYSKLNKYAAYTNIIDPLLIDILWKCPIKQLSQYIEKALVSITVKNKEIYQAILNKRLPECEKESQAKRLEKALKKINIIK